MAEENKLYWNIDSLEIWDKNPRDIKEEDYERLKKQIKSLGEYKPLIVNSGKHIPERGEVLGGNMRLRAYRDLGYNKAWVSLVHPKTEAEKLKYALSDNDRAGYYVEDELVQLVSQYKDDFDISEYNVDLKLPMNLEQVLGELGLREDVGEDEFDAELGEKAVSKLGIVYKLGEHRLLCGDALKAESYKKLLGDKKAHMVFTDPPFNVGLDYHKYDDRKSPDEYKKFCREFMVNLNFNMMPGATVYIMSGNMYLLDLSQIYREIFRFSQVLLWIKDNPTLGHSDYQFNYEATLYGWKKGATHDFYGGNVVPAANIVARDTGAEKTLHPAQRPLKLVSDYIQNSSKKGQLVLDVFGGSGSTLISAEKTGRVCYMMELDPLYCDVIRKRYANLSDPGGDWEKLTPEL